MHDPVTNRDGFDANALPRLERMVGSDVVDEVLSLYRSSAPKRIEAVRAGLSANDHDTVARALHDLKSSAGMVGAEDVMHLAEEMERLARAEKLEMLPQRLERLEKALRRADALLREALKRRDT